ncbi:MAG: M16 family metallopeptidase [Anaerolineae bacterium]
MSTAQFALPNASNITQIRLDNSVQVLVYENPTVDSVVVYGSLLAGSIHDPQDRIGTASLTADALLRGTDNRDFDQLNSALEDIGAELSITAGKHRTMISGRALAEDFAVLVDILADALQHPVFDAQELVEEQRKRITELNFAHQDTRYMAGQAFRENLYPVTHPYHYSSYGTPETLPQITADNLRAFHHVHYRPDGLTLVIVGAVDAAQVSATLADALASWHNPHVVTPITLQAVTPPQQLVSVNTAIAGKTQADIVIGTLGPARSAEDYLSAQLANSILGEFGMMGRVGYIIREQLGLAYYAYSRLEGGEGPGAWAITAGVAPENVELTIEKARDEINKLTQKLVSVDDLDDNKSYFTGRLPLRLESNFGLAVTIHAIVQHDLGLDYIVNYPQMIERITREDLLASAQRYLHPEHLVISVAG